MMAKSTISRFHMGGSKPGTEALTEDEQSILRSELWELMRISRPGAIYESSAAAQTFTEGEICDSEHGIEAISNSLEEEMGMCEIRSEPEHMPGYQEFLSKIQSNANKANLLGEIRRSGNQKTHFTDRGLIFERRR